MNFFRSLAVLPVLGLAFCAVSAAPRTVALSAQDAASRVFVADRSAKAQTGPGSIAHAEGVRSGDESDDRSQTVLAADGTDLLFSLEKWRAGAGTAEITHLSDGRDQVKLRFTSLIAFGVYSVFVADLNNPDAAALLALDGRGDTNNFIAAEDGSAALTVTTRDALTNEEALVLIYHSDDTDHGPAPGTITVDAHEQMIAHL